MAFGRVWGGAQSSRDCARFYHYPYVYYPQNFMGQEAFQSSDSLYYRYRPEMQIPVYNRHWHNYYPSPRRYHWGHHFITDVF
ncbi:MAG: calmodulin-binding protein [bacterium]|nr:calmodulin-binding protein [bacterium]